MTNHFTSLRGFVEEVCAGDPEIQRALSVIQRAHLPIPTPLKEIVAFPDDLSGQTPAQLSQQLGQWARVSNYANMMLTMVEIAHSSAKRVAEHRHDSAMAKAALTTSKVTIQRQKAKLNESYRRAQDAADRLGSLVAALRMVRDTYDKNYAAISRQFGMAEAEMKYTGRRA